MKTAVVTGGNSGIGKATAIELAKKGYKVIIHGRDAAKTKDAVEEIKKVSGSKEVEGISADVTNISGMKELVGAIKQKTDSINVLVLSIGVILPNHVITNDGLEAGFAIQYLSRFTVVNLLNDELKKGHARIVMAGAPTLKSAQIYFDDIALKNGFSMMKALGQEMLANHLFVQEYAKRNPGKEVSINIFHVGVVKTGIMRHSNFFFRLMVNLFGKSPEQATHNPIYLSGENIDFTGYFLPKPDKPEEKVKVAFDPKVAERLWNESMEMIK